MGVVKNEKEKENSSYSNSRRYENRYHYDRHYRRSLLPLYFITVGVPLGFIAGMLIAAFRS
jgi:hypothetical protein